MSDMHRSTYRIWIEVPLAATIYLVCFSAKLALWTRPTFSQSDWQELVIVNTVECLAWTLWTLARHGKEIGAIFLPLPLICSVYASISVGVLAAGLNVYPFADAAVRTGMLLQSLMNSSLWLLIAVFISQSAGTTFRATCLSWLDGIKTSNTGVLLFMFCGVVIAVLYLRNFYSSGAYKLLALASRDRGEILDVAGAGRTWILVTAFTVWLMVNVLIWLSKDARRAMGPARIFLEVVAISIFCFGYLRLGNRREMTHVLMLWAILLCMKGRTRLVAIVFACAVLLGLYVGISRSYAYGSSDPQLKTEIATDPTDFYLSLFSEAIFPNYPLMDHIEKRHSLSWGFTYLRLPGYISPTFGLWKKPLSLGDQFSHNFANGAMGFAYTPLGEGYDNFGIAAALITPFMLIVGEWFLIRVAFVNPRSSIALVPALIFLSFPMDIVRGEFVTITNALVLYCALALGYLWLCRLGVRRQV